MANYEEARVKLTHIKPNKLKYVLKSNTETTLRITKKNLLDDELPHEVFKTERQKIK